MHRVSAASSALHQLREALRSGLVTPRAAVEQALSRANSNAGHNVYLALDAERALRDADQLPQRFPDTAKPPLYGLPVSLKDCFDFAGFITTAGSRFYAQRNAAAVEDSAENPDYGDCTQPCNPALLTAGSSSGAAASVQEGSAVAAIGTDTGGSIRVPAAICGLAGYRASIELATPSGEPATYSVGAGLAPSGVNLWRGAVHLAPSFDTLGWLFRDLRDAALLGAALFELDVPATAETNVRIGVVAREFLHDCDPQVFNGFMQWQERLSELGATIVPIESSYWEGALEIYAPIQASEAAAIHKPATNGDFSHFEPTIAERLTRGASLTTAEVQQFRQRHAAFREQTDALLRDHDFLILPCAPIAQLAAGADHSNTRKAILRYTTPFSLAGVPVVTAPAQGGAGVQLAAARGADARLLSYATHLGAKT